MVIALLQNRIVILSINYEQNPQKTYHKLYWNKKLDSAYKNPVT